MKNLEISYSTHNDLPFVKKLWKNVFRDTDAFINQFFYHLYNDNILIAKIKYKIIAMAALLPATFVLEGKEYRMRYVYACTTDSFFRGKGIMSKILDKVFEEIEGRGEDGLFLLPANNALYDFYRKNGFQKFFYHDRQEYVFHDFAEKKNDLYQIQKISAEEYYYLRNSYLQNKNANHYPLSHFQFLEDDKINYPAKFYEILHDHKNIAIAFIEKSKDKILAREFLCKEFDMEMLYSICQQFKHSKIILHTPGKMYCDAMLRSKKQALLEKGLVGYFNFALD